MTRIAVISDVHADMAGLYEAVERLTDRVDTMWFLGDAVGRGDYPVQVMKKLVALYNALPPEDQQGWLAGNHDLLVTKRIDAMFFGGTLPNNSGNTRDTVQKALEHRRILEDEGQGYLEWLGKLEPYAEVRPGIVLTHGSLHIQDGHVSLPESYSNYVTTDIQVTEEIKAFQRDNGQNLRILMHGNTHIPSLWRWSPETQQVERLDCQSQDYFEFEDLTHYPIIVNPGSVAFPRGQDRHECSFAILTLNNPDGAALEFVHWSNS